MLLPPIENQIQMSCPKKRTSSNIKKWIFSWFVLVLFLGSYWSSLQTVYLPRCGEGKILHWTEWSCLLPSWLQVLYRILLNPFFWHEGRMRLNARVVTACQVLLTSQPSWRLESDKPSTREGDLFFEGLGGLISTTDNRRIFALMSVEVGSSCNWWERRMCFTIFVFLAKMGMMSLISVPTVRQPFYLQLNLCNYKM